MSIAQATSNDIETLFRHDTGDVEGSNTVSHSIDSYNVFENIRKQAKKIISHEKYLSENDPFVFRSKMNFWIFDRLINGPWEFEESGTHEAFAENGEKIHFGTYAKNVIPGFINLKGDIIDGTEIQTWSPIIALYSKAKDILLINEAYYRSMGTTPLELGTLIREGRMAELFESKDTEKLEKLTLLLSQGLGYKNESLHSSRTGKIIAWNSFGNETSGSIRIGKDITHGEHSEIPFRGLEKFSLDAEKFMESFAKNIENYAIKAMSPIEAQSTRTRLRALSACASAVDMFWEHGPYLMNMINNGKIFGNQNYADLIGQSAKNLATEELYDPEQLSLIEQKFVEGRKTGHYEQEFIMIPEDGISRSISWHRYFPRHTPGLEVNMTFGIGTTAITPSQRRSKR